GTTTAPNPTPPRQQESGDDAVPDPIQHTPHRAPTSATRHGARGTVPPRPTTEAGHRRPPASRPSAARRGPRRATGPGDGQAGAPDPVRVVVPEQPPQLSPAAAAALLRILRRAGEPVVAPRRSVPANPVNIDTERTAA